MTFEYFDRKAPWNRKATPHAGPKREALVRKHVDAHFKKTPTNRYASRYRHGLESLLMEIVPCRSHSELTFTEVFNAFKVRQLAKTLCTGFGWSERQLYRMKTLTPGQKEKIVRALTAADRLPLYRFTQDERIRQASV